jgi:hypothetical protein
MVGVEYTNPFAIFKGKWTQYNQWVMASAPKQELFLDTVKWIQELVRKETETGIKLFDAVYRTGPVPWSQTIRKYMEKSRVYSFPLYYGYHQLTREGIAVMSNVAFNPPMDYDLGPNALVVHGFQGSWKPRANREIRKQYQNLE